MTLVETKTYKIDMADAEREHLEKLTDELDAIGNLFLGKIVMYLDFCEDRTAMDITIFEQVIEFLDALANDKVEVIG